MKVLWSLTLLFVLIVSSAFSSAHTNQNDSTPEPDDDLQITLLPPVNSLTSTSTLIDTSAFPQITLRFTIRDSQGWINKQLIPEEISLLEDGQEIPVIQVLEPRRFPLNLLLVIDSLDPYYSNPLLASYLDIESGDLGPALEPINELIMPDYDFWLVCNMAMSIGDGQCIDNQTFIKQHGNLSNTPLGALAAFGKGGVKINPACPDHFIGEFIKHVTDSLENSLLLLITRAPNLERCGSVNGYLSLETVHILMQKNISLMIVDATLLNKDLPRNLSEKRKQVINTLSDRAARTGGEYYLLTLSDYTSPSNSEFNKRFQSYVMPVYELTYESHVFNNGKKHEIELVYKTIGEEGKIRETSLLEDYEIKLSQQHTALVAERFIDIGVGMLAIIILFLFLMPIFMSYPGNGENACRKTTETL